MSDGKTSLFNDVNKHKSAEKSSVSTKEKDYLTEYSTYMAFPFNPFNPWENNSTARSKWYEYPDLKASEVILKIKKEMIKNSKLLEFYLKDAKIDKESYITKLRENPEEIVKEDVELFGYYRKVKNITYSSRIKIDKK